MASESDNLKAMIQAIGKTFSASPASPTVRCPMAFNQIADNVPAAPPAPPIKAASEEIPPPVEAATDRQPPETSGESSASLDDIMQEIRAISDAMPFSSAVADPVPGALIADPGPPPRLPPNRASSAAPGNSWVGRPNGS
jgi:hypothetical protein